MLLNADVYVDVVDRHFELAREVAELNRLLDYFEPSNDDRRRSRESHSNPAVPFEDEFDNQLTDRFVAITQLAEELDRATLELALSIVRVEWWAARHGTTAPTASVDPELLSETTKAGRPLAWRDIRRGCDLLGSVRDRAADLHPCSWGRRPDRH